VEKVPTLADISQVDDTSDSSYSGLNESESSSDSDSADSSISDISADEQPLSIYSNGILAWDRLAAVAQEADLWRCKWGGMEHWHTLIPEVAADEDALTLAHRMVKHRV
jgi:hypothetical protein